MEGRGREGKRGREGGEEGGKRLGKGRGGTIEGEGSELGW
jgi:hypothetical protein